MRLIDESDADPKRSMSWLKKSFNDPHTESYLCGAQELATITRYHEKHILKNREDDQCFMCKHSPPKIFLGACDLLAKREYFTRQKMFASTSTKKPYNTIAWTPVTIGVSINLMRC